MRERLTTASARGEATGGASRQSKLTLGDQLRQLSQRIDADRHHLGLVKETVRARLFGGEQPDKESQLFAGRYRIESFIGRGSMGTVYRAVDTVRAEPVALKWSPLSRSATDLHFRREFHTLASLHHSGIVGVYDYGVDESGHYYTMELLSGGPDRLARGPLEQCCRVVRDVALALGFLHARALIHRDLSSRNVRITARGSAKLIDFGMLATIGVEGSPAGTPPFMAPENLHRQRLDHRADLFSLGAFAYWLLTGQHAFAAKNLEQLAAMTRRRPPAPSSRRQDIPPALDDLVLSLLRRDPLARPSSAAEVIHRLTAIVSLPAPPVEASRGYLASAALVGREAELATIKRALDRLLSSEAESGAAFVIEGPSGMGKSRLLGEVGLQAQLLGVTVATSRGDASRIPNHLLRDLAAQVLTARREDALQAAQPRLDLIGPLLRQISEPTGSDFGPPLPGDAAEMQIRLQDAARDWLAAVAQRGPLVLLVDDLQFSDEASAAVIAGLALIAATSRLLLVVGIRSDEGEKARVPVALPHIQATARRMVLGALEEAEVSALTRNLFGDVPHVSGLAATIHAAAGGSPLMCVQLARHLVEQGTIRFADGMWLLPAAVVEQDLPIAVADAMDRWVQHLSPATRRVAQALSLVGKACDLRLAVAVARPMPEGEVFDALDELVAREFLVGDGQRYTFRHDGFREALVRSVDAPRKRKLHLRVAEVLEAEELPEEREVEIGWHLLHGGQDDRAARLLERAGRRLYHEQALRDALPALEAALSVYRRLQVRPREQADLLQMLIVAGSMVDRQAALRYADEGVATLWRHAGLDQAERLGVYLGRHLAFVWGLISAGVRWLFAPRQQRGPSPVAAMPMAVLVAMAAALCLAHHEAVERLARLVRRMRALDVFRGSLVHGAASLARVWLDIHLGQLGLVSKECARVLRILEDGRLGLPGAYDAQAAEAAVRNTRAWVVVIDHDPAYAEDIDAIEGMGLSSFQFSCSVFRILFHRFRGEEPRALQLEAQAEHQRIQARSLWMWETTLCRESSLAYGLTGDVLGLRRCIDTLQRLTSEGFELQPYLDLAWAQYHRERNDFDTALACLTGLARQTTLSFVIQQHASAALAETLYCVGDHASAVDAARRGCELSQRTSLLTLRLRCEAAWGLAEAHSPHPEAAIERIDRAIIAATERASPALCGLLHRARALAALVQQDQKGFRHHCAEVERWLRPTANPVLVARLERLMSRTHAE